MILWPSFADVMQQHRDIENLAVHAALQDRRGYREFFDQLALFNARKVGDALDRVFVHGIAVVHVELHHRHDGFKFGNERGQHAKLVHPPQRAFRIAVLEQQIMENALCLRGVAHAFVDQMKIGFHQPHRIGVDQHAGAQRFLEQAQDVQLVCKEVPFVLDRDAVVHHLVARLDPRTAAEHALQQRFCLDVDCFKVR